NNDTRGYEMLVRVRDFGTTTYKNLFLAKSLGAETLAEITSAAAEVEKHAASQVSGMGAARESASSKATARATLREALDAVSRTARVLALDTPGLDNKFRMPR